METNSDDFIAPTSQTSFTNSHNCACALVPVFGLSLGRINILYLSQLLYNMSTQFDDAAVSTQNLPRFPSVHCPDCVCSMPLVWWPRGWNNKSDHFRPSPARPAQPSPAQPSPAQPSQVRGQSGDSIQMWHNRIIYEAASLDTVWSHCREQTPVTSLLWFVFMVVSRLSAMAELAWR